MDESVYDLTQKLKAIINKADDVVDSLTGVLDSDCEDRDKARLRITEYLKERQSVISINKNSE